MIKSKIILLFDNLYIYALLLVFVILTSFNLIFIIPFIILIYLARKNINIYILFFLIIILVFGLYQLNLINNSINRKVLIINKESLDYYYRYTIIYRLKYYQFTSNKLFNSGDIILIKGIIEPFKKVTIPNGFNQKTYFLSQNIYGNIYNYQSTYYKSINIFKIRDLNSPFIKLLKDYNFNDINEYSFLFSLSSIHLSFLIIIINKMLYYLNIKNKSKYLVLSFLLFVFYFIGSSILVLRYLLIYFIKFLEKRINFNLDNLNRNSLVFILILLSKPNVIYNYSFIIVNLIFFLNYLITFKNNISNHLLVPLILFPFFIIWQNEVDLTMIIFIPILITLVKYLFIPTIFTITILPFLNLLEYFNKFFSLLIDFIKRYQLKIYFPKFSLEIIVIYFLLLIFIFTASNYKTFFKRTIVLLLIFTIGIIKTKVPKEDQVIFLDVGQGDGAVIFKNDKTIVIDAFNGVNRYLKSMYVKEIEYLILTHSDLDHIKEADTLINNFKVKYLVLNMYDEYNLIHPHIIKVGNDNLPEINELSLNFIGPKKNYFNSNDNSIVLSIVVNDLIYLFAGDISSKVELDLVNDNNLNLKSDILKVAHHGSNTSSHYLFLNKVNPKYAIISASIRNIHNLPNDEIIDQYLMMGIKLYETRYDGSIIFKKNEILTYPP